MKDNLTPFPGAGGKPNLPKMDIAERKLWSASHNLPESILLIYEDEMRVIQQKSIETVVAFRRWSTLGRLLLGTPNVEEAFERLQSICARLEVVDKTGLKMADGSLVTADRAVLLLDDELARTKKLYLELAAKEEELRQLRAHIAGETAT